MTRAPWPILLAAAAAAALSPGRAAAEEPSVAPSTETNAPAVAPPRMPANPPEPTTPAPSMSPLASVGRVPVFVTGGLAVVLAGIGAAFGVMSISDHSTFSTHPSAATANAGESHELIADMCFGGALTLGVASIVMALTREEASSRTPQTRSAPGAAFLPVISPRGAGLVVRF
jgi:hypothetical protein